MDRQCTTCVVKLTEGGEYQQMHISQTMFLRMIEQFFTSCTWYLVRYIFLAKKNPHDIIVIFMNLPFCKMNQQAEVPPRVQETESNVKLTVRES